MGAHAGDVAAPSLSKAAPPPPLKASFAPVYRTDARLLVLGSLPGDASLAAARYYAHPHNQFWRLMGAVIDAPLAELAYAARLERLQSAGVALWDVVAEAERRGSLDTAIRNVAANDLHALIARLPQLKAIAFNGQRAAAIGARVLGKDSRVPTFTLPSSSPAFTRRFEDKQAEWLTLKANL